MSEFISLSDEPITLAVRIEKGCPPTLTFQELIERAITLTLEQLRRTLGRKLQGCNFLVDSKNGTVYAISPTLKTESGKPYRSIVPASTVNRATMNRS